MTDATKPDLSKLIFQSDQDTPHPKFKNGDEVIPSGSFIMSFDTKSLTVADYAHLGDSVPLEIVKGVASNTLENFASNYAQSLILISNACEPVRKRIEAGRDILPPDAAKMFISRSQARLEEAHSRLMTWDGKQPFHAILPYAITAIKPSELIGKEPVIDTENTHPYINGILFTVCWAGSGALVDTGSLCCAEA